MGARPLRRVIQLKVEDRLSDAVLASEFTNGDTVVVDIDPETDEIYPAQERGDAGRIGTATWDWRVSCWYPLQANKA
jgi:ribosomal protein L21E